MSEPYGASSGDDPSRARRALVSLLGLGPAKAAPPYYEPRVYRFGGNLSSATPLVQRAIVETLGPFEHVDLLATRKVRGRWLGEDRLFEELARVAPSVREIPEGARPDENWQIFRIVHEALDARRDAGEIVLDVTHSFRSHGMIAISAAQFVASDWRRLRLDKAPGIRIVYGALEAADESGIVPIWDLTDILAAARWNSALDALARYGRADELEALAREQSKSWVRAARDAGVRGVALAGESLVATIGSAARTFADDLALARVPQLVTQSAPRLRDALNPERNHALGDLARRLPVLGPTIRWLRERVAPLCGASILESDGVEGGLQAARFMLAVDRYSEMAAALRETFVTWNAIRLKHDPGRGRPSGRIDDGARHVADSAFGALVAEGKSGSSEPIAQLASRVAQVRNDVQHAGFRGGPQKAAALREELARLLDEVDQQFARDRREPHGDDR